jgi:hypothetical protein
VTEHQVDSLAVREHVRAHLREAFVLHADPTLTARRFGPCAHGRCLTKSRRCSTTFKALREAQAFDDEIRRRRRTGELALLDAGRETLDEFVTGTWVRS